MRETVRFPPKSLFTISPESFSSSARKAFHVRPGIPFTLPRNPQVLRVIRTVSLAESVYGTRQRALEWLRKPNPRLDGRAPLSLLTNDMGSRIVEELLVQIDEGMFV